MRSGPPFHPFLADRRIIGVFLLALLLRVAFVAYHAHLGWQLQFDPGYYLTLARNLQQGAYSLFHPQAIPDTTRMPGYPVLIFLLGGSIPAVLLLQALLSALKVPLVCTLALRTGVEQRFALLAGLLMALEPMDILLTGSLLSESVFTFVLLVAMGALVRAHNWRHAVVAGVCFAVATWFRPNGALLLSFAALVMVISRLWPWQRAIVFIAVGALLVMPWALRNQRATGRLVLTDAGVVAAAYFHVPQVLRSSSDPNADQYRDELHVRASSTDWEDPAAASSFFNSLRHDLWRTLREHPTSWAVVQLRDATGIYLSPGRGHIRSYFGPGSVTSTVIIILSSLVSLLLLLALMVWVIGVRKITAPLRIALLIAGAIILTGAISTPDARFKNPAMPLLLIGVAWAAQHVMGRIRKRIRTGMPGKDPGAIAPGPSIGTK